MRWNSVRLGQFIEENKEEVARAIFKKTITMVEIEVFSFCNRRCWFCPNSKIDRHSDNKYMDRALYTRIIEQLSEISYDKMITYSRYNEPLSDKIIIERLNQARRALPRALLHANTNGDYLSHDYLKELYDAGLRSLNIQFYLGKDERYDHQKIKRVAEKTLDQISLPATISSEIEGEFLGYRLEYKDMSINAYGRNFVKTGTNRGGQVDINHGYIRTAPCLVPFWSTYIDYNGMMMPCCNLRSDIPEHAPYVMEDMSVKKNLFLAYMNEKNAQFRRSVFTNNEKIGLCRSCSFLVPQVSDEKAKLMADLTAEYTAIGETGKRDFDIVNVSFGRFGNHRDFILMGWSTGEELGCWNDGTAASLVLPVPCDKKVDLLVEARFLVFHAETEPQRIEIAVNGYKLGVWEVQNFLDSENHREVWISRSIIGDSPHFELEFRFSRADSPRDLGFSEDARRLSCFFLSLTVSTSVPANDVRKRLPQDITGEIIAEMPLSSEVIERETKLLGGAESPFENVRGG
jgi:hypothetical protein